VARKERDPVDPVDEAIAAIDGLWKVTNWVLRLNTLLLLLGLIGSVALMTHEDTTTVDLDGSSKSYPYLAAGAYSAISTILFCSLVGFAIAFARAWAAARTVDMQRHTTP
jgi:hypothetical protein